MGRAVAQVTAIQPLLFWVKEGSLWAHNAGFATSIDDGAPPLNSPLPRQCCTLHNVRIAPTLDYEASGSNSIPSYNPANRSKIPALGRSTVASTPVSNMAVRRSRRPSSPRV